QHKHGPQDSAEQGTSSPAAGTSQVPQDAPPDASEDANCPICLDTINDEAYVSWCKHRFCFPCIQKWAHIKAVCPICPQPLVQAPLLFSLHTEVGPHKSRVPNLPAACSAHLPQGGR
uniref:RING-type E3 ubiquitin transferase n=1 Tax=Buteo japonicus TaxID=224669 RepID=A0A8B9ZBL4_9AVES